MRVRPNRHFVVLAESLGLEGMDMVCSGDKKKVLAFSGTLGVCVDSADPVSD